MMSLRCFLGGVKASGYGRFGGKAAIEEFTILRWITIQQETDTILLGQNGPRYEGKSPVMVFAMFLAWLGEVWPFVTRSLASPFSDHMIGAEMSASRQPSDYNPQKSQLQRLNESLGLISPLAGVSHRVLRPFRCNCIIAKQRPQQGTDSIGQARGAER
jgi:hypothetical protein